jgi:hypothetical protein
MTVADRELCIELKELSNWGGTDFCWNGDHLTPAYWPEDMRSHDLDSNPAYDTAYLLDKLVEVKTGLTLYHVHSTMSWEAFYAGKFFEYGTNEQHWDTQGGMNPADALCRLAIQMIKEGKLKV